MSSLGKASQVKVNDDFMSTPSEVQTFIRKRVGQMRFSL